jgi:parallel beta-helix repeat protein
MLRARFIVYAMAETAVMRVPADYPTIQAAINSANSGDTVLVAPGTYNGSIAVNKTISLLGEDRATTIIEGGHTSNTILVTANGATISNFTIQNSGYGIYLYQSFNNTITSNNIHTGVSGIIVDKSNSNILADNNISNTWMGIVLAWSNSNIITDNDAYWNDLGIRLQFSSNHNTIAHNDIHSNGCGISLEFASDHNTVVNNNIYSNGFLPLGTGPVRIGIGFSESSYNRVFHNNFIHNTAYAGSRTNFWDDGYPSGGNYWSDYNDTDLYNGPYQNVTGSDGIGDIAYNIDSYNKDRYPLKGPISLFNAGKWNDRTYTVETVSNSTVSDFYFSESEKLITFNVTGPSYTDGFCRVTVPNELLWCDSTEQWQVWVNNTLIEDRKIIQGTNQTYIYFTYSHSTQNVRIMGTDVTPEFPTWISILLVFFMLSATAVVIKRKTFKTTNHFS